MTQQPQAKYRHDYGIPDFLITDITLDFALDAQITRVTALSQVVRQREGAKSLVLNGEDLILKSVKVNDEPWPYYRQTDEHLILEHPPETFRLTIVTEICPAKNSALEGLYSSGNTLCTQCEAEGFRHITYYLDRPDVLARFRTRIVADKARYPYLLSNGNRIDQGELEGGRHWVLWEDPFPKPCYLFALVAGDFDRLQDYFTTCSGREVALELYVDRGYLDSATWAMASLKNAMKWDETRFSLEYDLDIYMIVAVDFFNMGAMENKGLNIFNTKYILAKPETATDKDYLAIEAVIGHEYFHNWTGNRVTCRDWFQLSLKEGLTVFREQEFSADMGSRAYHRIENVKVIRGAQFAEDASPMAHPIRPDKVIEMNNFYTLTVYEKGAEVIRMLHTLLGEKAFQQGTTLYLTRYDGRAATCDDFVQAMEEASGQDLTQFRRWYSQSGTPQLTVRDEYDAQKQQYRLYVTQYTAPTADQPEKLPLHIPLYIALYDPQGAEIPLITENTPVDHILSITESEQSFAFDQVSQSPIPSLLGHFSAPVKMDYPYSDRQLTFLMQQVEDEFSRWDAAQMLLAKYVRLNVVRAQQGQPLSLPLHVVDAFREVLLDTRLDPSLVAQILTLASQNEMGELFTIIDPIAIAGVHDAITRLLAKEMAGEWLAVYHLYSTSEYRVGHDDIAKRTLRNVCLHYLAFAEDIDQADKLVCQHYQQANNMTDTLAALAAAVAAELPCCDRLMDEFERRWQDNGLVMDKWFTLQAKSPSKQVLNNVNELLKHPAFSLSNPNRTRALIGAFATANPAAFHAEDGLGYQFLCERLKDLNTRNPQLASYLIEPLIRLRRYDEGRQALMRKVLEELKGLDNLSSGLFEKITKALD